VLACCEAKLLTRLDESLHGVAVWRWVVAVDIIPHAALVQFGIVLQTPLPDR